MRKLLWLIPLFLLTPVLISVLDLYATFVFGTGFLPREGCAPARLLTLLFSGFIGTVAIPLLIK